MAGEVNAIQSSSISGTTQEAQREEPQKRVKKSEKNTPQPVRDSSRLSHEVAAGNNQKRKSRSSSIDHFRNVWNSLPEESGSAAEAEKDAPEADLEKGVRGELQRPEQDAARRADKGKGGVLAQEASTAQESGAAQEAGAAQQAADGQGGARPADNMQMQMMQMMTQMMQTMTQMMQSMMQMMQRFMNNGGNNNNNNNNTNNNNNNNNNNVNTNNNNNNNNNNNGRFRYGNNVNFQNFQPQKNNTPTGGGNFLNDIESHLPSRYGTQYRDRDKVTWAHETTHGINAHVSNQNYDGGRRKTGLYVGDNRAVVLENPNMRKSDVKNQIPDALRGSRYNLYLNGQSSFENEPHYLLDEWAAYTNGLQTGVEMGRNGQGRGGNIVGLGTMGALEFTAYAFAEAKAISEKDPTYWSSEKGKQFKEFMAWHGLRAMDLVREGNRLEQSKESGQDRYLENFRSGASAQQLRDFISREFGEDYLRRLLS